MKFAAPLAEQQKSALKNIMKNSLSPRVRMRAHSILLSSGGYTINRIADIYETDRDMVSSRISLWDKFASESRTCMYCPGRKPCAGVFEKTVAGVLSDRSRSGRPPKLIGNEKDDALRLIGEYPRSLKTVKEKLRQTGKTVSVQTLKRLAKASGLVWKRIRKVAKSGLKTGKSGLTKQDTENLKQLRKAGETDLYYFDETGFDLQPPVPYAWQPEGETVTVPASRSPRLSVLGFFNTENNDFHPFTFECSVNSDIVVACFDRFSETVVRKTAVLADNSPVHTSRRFTENIEKRKEKGLFVMYILPYSPELNLIEFLWKFIKYFWLPFSAYNSFRDLVNEVENILRNIGSEYKINFSPCPEA